ncbi:unnamed protein product [Ectocarpus sp. 12 AP-2014]
MPSTLSKARGSADPTFATTDIDGHCGDTNQTPLLVASVIGSSRVVEDLLRQGASVSVVDSDGYTALHPSVYHKHLAVSKDLIEARADLEARPGGIHTPLHVAATKGFCQRMVMLIDAGANWTAGSTTEQHLCFWRQATGGWKRSGFSFRRTLIRCCLGTEVFR